MTTTATDRFDDETIRAEAATIATLPAGDRNDAIIAWYDVENATLADAQILARMVTALAAQPADPFDGLPQ